MSNQPEVSKELKRELRVLNQMQKTGTLSDKVSALMYKIQKIQELG
jgi:hypothetical protein